MGALTVILVSKRLARPWGTGNFFHKAFTKLGHRVVDIDLERHKGKLGELSKVQQEHGADLLFVLKGQGVDQRWVEAVKCPTVLWYQDDAIEWQVARDHLKSYGPVYDYVYYFDEAGLDLLRSLGIRDPKFLPCATDPEVYKRLGGVKKEYDVSFVGNVSPARRKMLDRLSERFKVQVATAFMDQMVAIFNKSKISFNLAVGKTGYPLRVFEALGMGSFLITNEVPVRYRLFEDRKHLVYYNDGNLEGLIDYYLKHDKEREVIAQNGYKEVVARHTFDLRVKKVLEDVI